MMENTKTAQELWQLFENCENVHTQMGIDEDTQSAYRFYEGDQWYGLESGSEQLPVYNFIAPLIKYKTAMVAMNNMCINYSAQVANERMKSIAVALSRVAAQTWERLDMDSKCWEAVKASMIAGDSYAYFYGDSPCCQILDRTDIFLGDESCTDINAQPYIFIRERKPVSEVIRIAKANGVSTDEITADDDDDDLGSDKCTSLLYLELIDGDLYFQRLTKNVEELAVEE